MAATACVLALILACWSSAAAAATLRVTTTADGLAPPGGGCTLRAAIEAVDSPGFSSGCGTSASGSNTIVLRAGQYSLSIAPQGDDGNSTGDLDVTARGPVHIIGAGASRTTIDAAGIGDRAMFVSGGASVTLGRLTITAGAPAPPRLDRAGRAARAAWRAATGATAAALPMAVASTTRARSH